ncbi:MAG: glycosyltransferase family 1 protein, partial [Deltaproteobacteria bacterium]|nr:glycosyltransferase family 1 protein [Deltaproteobacteria bacterium]
MKVLLLSRYESLGASSRVRFFQYLPYLEAHGVRVTVAPMLTDGYLSSFYARRWMPVAEIARSYLRRLVTLFRAGSYDLLWLEKELFPFLPAWGESLFDILGVPCVVDYDDATFHGYDHYAGRVVRTLMGNKIDLVMRRAALVVVGNDYLAERAHRAGARRVAYLPSVVDENRYRPAASRGDNPFTVGWIGSPTTASYLKTVETALAEVCGDGKGR